MKGSYGSAKVCPFEKQDCDLQSEGLTLEPSLEEIIGNPSEHSWDELVYVWKSWRDASGKTYRDLFRDYIAINNEAAEANSMTIYELS